MVCETCDQCPEDENIENKDNNIIKRDIDEFVQEFHEHGMKCGEEIAKSAKDIHPSAIAIIPLYRSCIVIEQSEEQKKEGNATIHTYADPHWLGEDITVENLKSYDFHSKFIVQGLREGPQIINGDDKEYKAYVNMERGFHSTIEEA